MYTPKIFNNDDITKAISFMKKFSFATIITSDNGKPIATHLPFVITERDGEIILTSHFAKSNNHSKKIQSEEILVIFTEPHAYISPKLYDKKENVPTWNYISVHTYGTAKLLETDIEVFQVLEQMIKSYDAEYLNQWNELSKDYKTKMAKGIIAFEIQVNELQFKEKISQNKSENERNKIIKNLEKSEYGNDVLLAEYMNEEKNK
jgi:transcriptional regulator